MLVHECMFFSSFVWWRVRIEPLCQFVVGTTIFKAPSCKVASRASNHGLHITCRDGSWRSRSKVSPVYAKHLSFYNTCVQRQGQQPLHQSLSERDPPSRKLNPGPMFVQYFMCAAFHLLNTQWITLCLKSYLDSRHDLILKQNFCMVYTSWLIYFL